MRRRIRALWRRLRAVAVVHAEDLVDVEALELLFRSREGLDVGHEPLILEVHLVAPHQLAIGEHDRLLHPVLQLADVPVPCVLAKRPDTCLREVLCGTVELGGVLLEQIAGDEDHVVSALPKRGEVESDHVQEVVEVLAE